MAENQIPYSQDSERSLLGSVMIDPSLMDTAVEYLRPEDFYLTRHQVIYDSLLALHESRTSIDLTTLSESLKNRGKYEESGGAEYLSDLEVNAPIARNVREYCKIIAEKSLQRKLIYSAQEIIRETSAPTEDVSELLETAESKIFKLTQSGHRSSVKRIQEILNDVVDTFEQTAKNRNKLTGLTTGFKELDQYTNGLHKSDLIIIAARPAMGKTAFALNVATNAALQSQAKVLIFSLEMSAEQLGSRILLSEAYIDSNKVRSGDLEGEKDWEAILGATDLLYNTSIAVDDTPGITLAELRSKCRREKAENGLDLVIIDYMQLMTGSSRSENRQNEVSEISRGLKQLAREMDCPVICLSQLARGPESRDDHRPRLSDLRESGSIEQDADIVMFLYRDAYYNKDEAVNPEDAELDIAKHRNGPTGKIRLRWLGNITKFTDPAPAYLDEMEP